MSKNKGMTISQLTMLVDQEVELFHDIDIPDRTYGQIKVGEATEIYSLESRRFRRWLTDRACEKYKERFGEEEASTVAKAAAAKAQFRCKGYKLAVRVGAVDGITYLDLAGPSGRMVKLTPKGEFPWEVIDSGPVKFLRAPGTLALPEPVRGGHINELKKFLNLDGQDPDPWILTVSWMLATLRPNGPYPALFMNGEQGTAKSTMSRIVKMMVDPNKAPIRSAPRNERDLLISTTNAWLLAFDNLSVLPDDLSDCICRVATGGGFSTRTLYTDCEEQIFYAMRPVVFNGIEEIVVRSDLLDRMVWITLPTIPDSQRVTEKELWSQFEEARPRMLGALLDVVSKAEADFDSVLVTNLPRMADFAQFAIAAEKHLGLAPGAFLKAYEANRKNADELVIEASSVGTTLRKLMERFKQWKGTSADLLDELNILNNKAVAQFSWPRTPRKLSGMLRRIAPNLRRLGIEVEFQERTGEARPIAILNKHFQPVEKMEPDDPELTRFILGVPQVTSGDGSDGDDDLGPAVSGMPTEPLADGGQATAEPTKHQDGPIEDQDEDDLDVGTPAAPDGSDGDDGVLTQVSTQHSGQGNAPETPAKKVKTRQSKVPAGA